MKKYKTKLMAVLLSGSILFTSFSMKASALSLTDVATKTIESTISTTIPSVCKNIFGYIETLYECMLKYYESNKYSGFKNPVEIIKNLEKITDNKSKVRVYDQKKAKKQMMECLSSVIARVDSLKRNKDIKEVRGNIIYLIGPSGTGKTKMCYAIADAFLKSPEKSCIFCHSESITSESELGTQLFKTILSKDIGVKRNKNIFGNTGLIPKDEESPMLKHILDWYESVVIIDEYEKMKQKSAKPGSTMNIPGVGNIPMGNAEANSEQVDKSADEILRSIASTGKYKFMNKEIDCSKVLFLITTNETREELERSFGINGTKGGGIQRLNVLEFDYLTLEACKGITNDFVCDVTEVLTDKEGPFRLKSVTFDEDSLNLMAKYIFDDKLMQGRAKYKLEDKIYSLFSKNMGKEFGQSFKISFVPNNTQNTDFDFIKKLN